MSETQKRMWWDSDSEAGEENTPAGKLKKYKLSRKPPIFSWFSVAPEVDLRVEENEKDKGEKAEKTQIVNIYKFRSRVAGAIDAFIDEAYAW